MLQELLLAFVLLPPAPSTPSVFIEDLTWPELRDAIAAGKATAIYCAGSTEQNGPHMAIGKHNFLARAIAERIARELANALVYPVMPFAPTGDPIAKTDHMRFPGSVHISAELFLGVARQVALSAIVAGFKNVVLMGDQGGGQDELALAAKGLDEEWREKGVHVYYICDLYYWDHTPEAKAYLASHPIPGAGRHASCEDTAEILAIDSAHKWIRRDKMAPSDRAQEAATGVERDPTKATVELGKMLIDWKVRQAVAQIRALITRKEETH